MFIFRLVYRRGLVKFAGAGNLSNPGGIIVVKL